MTGPARSEFRALAALAAPLAGANLLQMAVYAIDVMFVARLGAIDFAAATLGVFMFGLCLWALMGLTTACAPIIAAELGQRRHAVRQVRRSVRMALWLAVLASLPLMLALAHGEALLRLAGQDARLAMRAGLFLSILLFALIPSVSAGVMRTAAAALGRPNWAVGVMIVALGVGLAGNYTLVFGHFGAPALGLVGAAVASVITATATMLAYAAILTGDRHLRRYRLLGRWWRAEWPRLGEIVRLGLPIALSFSLEGALFGGAAILMGLIGVVDVAAHAIALNIAALAFQIPLGIAQATTIRVGLAFGASDRNGIARAGWTGIAMGTGVMLVTAMLIWTAPRLLIGIYIDIADPANATVAALAVRFLAVAAAFQLFDGAQVAIAGALRGLQDTRAPMLIAAFGYWVAGFGCAILLAFRLSWGGVGVWTGLAVGLAVVAALLLVRWNRRERGALIVR